jgi:cytochrome c oxidase cbb3-type subunit 3
LQILREWRAISSLLVTVSLLLLTSAHAQRTAGAGQSTTSLSPSEGHALFTTNCGACHGADGRGGVRAPDLATATEVLQLSDNDLTGVIRHGIPDMGMPAFDALAPEKIKAIVHYLRVLQGESGSAPLKLPGDKHAGELLFFGKAECSTCHMVNGKGGFIARDLSLYGSHESAEQIYGVITDPENKLTARSHVTTVVTLAGKKIVGMVRSSDNFSIALQTQDGSFKFFQKSDLQQIDVDAHSLMPDNYGSTLNRNEVNDLVSYILSVGTENASHITAQPSRPRDDDFDRD